MKLEKFKIIAFALSLACLVACDDSGVSASGDAKKSDNSGVLSDPLNPTSSSSVINDESSSSSENLSQGAPVKTGDYCEVGRDANSVWSYMGVDGRATSKMTVTKGTGRYVSIVSEYWFSSTKAAKYNCDLYQNQASRWLDGSMKVECTENTVIVKEVDEGSLDNHYADLSENCDEVDYDRIKNLLNQYE